MAVLTFAAFGGEAPLYAADTLPPGLARVARSLRVEGGQLRPLRGFAPVAGSVPASCASLYRFGRSQGQTAWLGFSGERALVRAAIPGDTTERTLMTGGPYPQVFDASRVSGSSVNPWRLGVPAPSGALVATVTGAIPSTDANPQEHTESRFYALTYVNAWGEEGAPGPLSARLEVHEAQQVTLTALPGAPGGAWPITAKRLYRTASGISGTAFLFVAELPIAQAEYVDALPASGLGEPLATADYDLPPENAAGLLLLPNGIYCAYAGNQLAVSAPYLPYAWPAKYRKTFPYEILGLAALDTAVVVATRGSTHIVEGFDPASLSDTRLSGLPPCVGGRSLVSIPGVGVLYAAREGLVAVAPGGSGLVTGGLLGRSEWQAFKPESIRAVAFEGRYYGFYDTGTAKGRGGFVFDPARPGEGLVQLGFYASAAFADDTTEGLYLVLDGTTTIQAFDADPGAPRPYQWCSGEIVSARREVFRYARVRGSGAGALTLRWFVNGALVADKVVADGLPFRLPAQLGTRFTLEVEGTRPLSQVVLATSRAELGGV